MHYATAQLPELISEARQISSRTMATFGTLSYEQLNWKPSAERWSVAQCFDHLVASGASFLPIIDSVIMGRKPKRVLERLPLLPSAFGRLLIKSLEPSSKRKFKAPKRIEPTNSTIESSILQTFVEQQAELVSKMKASVNLALDKIVITSPVSTVITYSLMDAYRIIVVHEERHFQQAQRVTGESAFPT